MQSSGHTPRSSTSPDRFESPSGAAVAPSRLNVDAQALDDPDELPSDRRASVNTAHDSIASRTTSASDQSHNSLYYGQYGSRRSRNSGGFLLPDPSSSPGFAASQSPNHSVDVKGKRKVEDGDLLIPKRGPRSRHQLKPSLGGSPLAVEVLNNYSTSGSENKHGDQATERLSVQSRGSGNAQSSPSSGNTPNNRKNGEARPDSIPALGFDTDPAQIVSLALSLSESRRRNFSGLMPPTSASGDRVVIAGGSPSPGLHAINGGGSLRQHLQQQRHISRNVSPRSAHPKRKAVSPRLDQNGISSPSPIVSIPDFMQPSNLAFSPSDATLSRAEKARVALELSYEYRRLLQYLPKLPPAKGRPSTSRRKEKRSPDGLGELGRSYNPLQYIRNRKVRLRERRPFESEAEGWSNLERVRLWVDTVANERELGIATIDELYPLPAFETIPTDSMTGDAILEVNQTKPSPVQGNKQRRPRLDWMITPWDMLADAYWLQHDGNIAHIEDATGHKIIPSPDTYKFPSVKNSLDLDRASHARAESTDRQAISPTKLRSPKQNARNERSSERNRPPDQLIEPESLKQRADGSRDRMGRWPRKFMRSRSSSSASDFDDDDPRRHRRGRRRNQDYSGGAVLEKHMMSLLAQENVDGDESTSQKFSQTHDENDAHRSTVTGETMAGSSIYSGQQESKQPNQARVAETLDLGTAHSSARSSFERPNHQRRATSFDDLDVTAPSSPNVSGFTPSIAINLSRPSSPHTSPKKQLPSFRPAKSKERQAISENDFALSSPSTTDISRQGTRDSKSEDVSRRERHKNDMNGFLSPTNDSFSKLFRRSDGISRGPKESTETDSKFRGFFRGGRIAELVGNEVGRVGGKFRRKDASNQASRVASSGSSHASDESDTESYGLDSSPEADTSHASNNRDREPKYHTANLPNFQSSFGKDTDKTKEPPAIFSKDDPIPRQQLAQRARGRSARFDRLAPPKIDLRNISPSPAPALTRTQTRNIVPSYDPFDSRQSSTSRSEGRVHDADRKLNAILGIPGTIGPGGPPMTGLASLESRHRRSRERPALEGKRQWSASDRSVSAVRGTVTKRDIARVRALLLSSGVKANEIVRRAHEVCQASSPVLQDASKISRGRLPPVSRSQEHVLAARIYASHIDENNKQLRDAAERFSNKTVDELHRQIKEVDERMTQKLTPLVRTLADEADAFSAQLTTTGTLEVKQLNDAVDAILRRRRRRLRWVRRGGYVLLEWILLGIMWWVWLIVVVIRLTRGTIRGFFRAVKWLLWL